MTGGINRNDTQGKWLAIAVLVVFLGLLIWTGGRSLIVVPMLAWTSLNLELSSWMDSSLRNQQEWILYSQWTKNALDAIFGGRIQGKDIPWNALVTLHGIATERTRWVWVGTGTIVTILALFWTRKTPPAFDFHLTGITKSEAFKIGSKIIKPSFWTIFVKPFAKKIKTWQQTKPSFFGYQTKAWPTTSVALRFGPTEKELPEPALTPTQWMMKVCPGLGQRDVPWPEAEHAFRQALVAQLGPRWRGFHAAPAHVRTLGLLAWTNRFRGQEKAAELAGVLAEIFNGKAGPTLNPIPPWNKVAKPLQRFLSEEANTFLEDVARRHAFIGSAFVAILASGGPFPAWGGGEAGVLAPAQYLWLRLYDRVLWYAAQNIGRHAYFIEGAACATHMLAERAVGKPIPRPHIDDIIFSRDEFGNIHGLYGTLISLKLIPSDTPAPPDILKAEWFKPLMS